jgi:hypothetical protein
MCLAGKVRGQHSSPAHGSGASERCDWMLRTRASPVALLVTIAIATTNIAISFMAVLSKPADSRPSPSLRL